MGYYCTYSVYKNEKKADYFGQACYANCYASIGQQVYDKVDVYVLTDYAKVHATDSNSMPFTKEEVYEYTLYLKRCGLYLTMVESIYSYAGHSIPCYIFTVYCHLNTGLGNLMLLNAIRYLHENTGIEVARSFLHLGRAKYGPSYMNRLLISHNHNSHRNGGHVMTLSMDHHFLLLNEEQIEKIVKGKNNASNTYALPRYLIKEAKDVELLTKKIYEQDPKNIFETISTLSEKYIGKT